MCNRLRLNQPVTNHGNACRQRLKGLISATPDGKERVEAGYSRVAVAALRASERDSRICASAPAADPDAQPPASAVGWFVGNIREWRMWRISGNEPSENPAWRKSYLDRRMTETRRM